MIAIGPSNFRNMLAGMRAMDAHRRTAPVERSLPAPMGVLAGWNEHPVGAGAWAGLPFEEHLARVRAYLQALTAEINGRRAVPDGPPEGGETVPGLNGEPDARCQPLIADAMRAERRSVPAGFIDVGARPIADRDKGDRVDRQHELMIAKLFVQAELLAFGRTAHQVLADAAQADLAAQSRCDEDWPGHRTRARPGNPLTSHALGARLERSAFAIRDVEPLEQQGAELGKTLSVCTVADLPDEAASALPHVSAASALIQRYRPMRASRA